MTLKRLLIATLVATAFALGYGAVSWAFIVNSPNRNPNYGYFYNLPDGAGTNVLPAIYDGNANAIPNYVDTAAEYIGFIEGNLSAGSGTQKGIGAAFIINTMEGGGGPSPSASTLRQWEQDVYYYEGQGWINWNFSYTYSINTYYQGTGAGNNYVDDAFYYDNGTATTIVFGHDGVIQYTLRRACANPVMNANLNHIDMDVYVMSGSTTVSNASPSPGDTITFSHYVKNTGPNTTAPTHIFWGAVQTIPAPETYPGGGDAGSFNANQQKNVFNHTFVIPPATPPGTQYCELVAWVPSTSWDSSTPRGSPVCATVSSNYSLTPTVNVTVNGGSSTGGAEVGDNVTFTYAANNAGPGGSASVGCTVYGLTKPGSYAVPTPADSTSDPGFVSPATGCPRTFALGNTTIASETIDSGSIAAGNLNKTICRSLYVDPASSGGAAAGAEACVRIVAKPYARAYGGDVSAGNGLDSGSGACATNAQAAVVGWNRGSANGYAGAGAQFAVMAINQINDFSTALGNSGGATTPSGLAFANTTTGGSNFGGSFGSMPCIQNYYGTMPGSVLALPASVSSMVSGSYAGAGPVTLGGGSIVNPNNRITVYINGDVFISSNITYSGSWSVGSMPLFRLIVRGNIIIDNDVSQLDGLYIAQQNGATGGTIYTCGVNSSGTTPFPPTDPTFYSQCSHQKLTVNGAFIANQVQLGRTIGTLSKATAGETDAAGSAAEAFNYSPIMWIPQPSNSSNNGYDAITTLPPVL